MLLITRDDVGAPALARMGRDGVVISLTDDAGVPTRLAPPHVARALAVGPWIPRRAAATGLAALWVHGLTRDALAPARIEVVVPRGSHPDAPVGVPHSRWGFTTHQVAYSRAEVIAGVRIVLPADAAASALCGAPLADAMVAVYRTLARDVATAEELCAAISRHKPAFARKRALEALRTVQEALRPVEGR